MYTAHQTIKFYRSLNTGTFQRDIHIVMAIEPAREDKCTFSLCLMPVVATRG